MARGPPAKPDSDFWKENLGFFLEMGDKMRPYGEVTDRYNDHSVVKLIAMVYWVGIFVPIVRKRLVEPYGYSMVYIDTMAGSGVTETARQKDFFLGSCPAALLAAEKRNHPFDGMIGVEPNAKRAAALKARLKALAPSAKYRVLDQPLTNVATIIHGWFEKKATSFAFIDPEGFEGMTWQGIEPVLRLKGDAMVTWFEADAYRMKEAGLSGAKSAAALGARMDELFGPSAWREATSGEALTQMFCERVESTCAKIKARQFAVTDREGERYKLLLFAGEGCPQALPGRWLDQMNRRIPPGTDIATLVDVEKGRAKTLFDDYP
jgi:three-Cys-motif partner protein